MSFIWPFDPDQYASSEYGPRTGGTGTFHEGIDLAPAEGTPIPAAGDGIVEANYYHANFGNLIILFHGTYGDVDLRTLYAHRISLGPFAVNDPVTQGQTIGLVGNTGVSFGAHLHWETHVSAIGSGIVWNTNDDSGYRTAINPRDFMVLYGDDPGPDPTPRRRRPRRAWMNRPPTIYYRTW